MKQLSVIIPVYNGEKFISQCINNIKQCTLDNIEFIFIDDGSTDRTSQELKKYLDSDHRLRYFHQENQGVSAARNFGIKCSTGAYIGFLDIDDQFEPHLYEDLLNEIKKQQVDLVISSVKTNKMGKLELKDLGLEPEVTYQVDEQFMANFMLNEINGSPWNKLYKSEILKQRNIQFDQEISIGEDYLFNLSYLKYVTKICYLNHSSYLYSVHPNSAMTSYNSRKFLGYNQLQEKCLTVLKDVNPKFINYQYLRYLTWVNNCFIDEIRLNQSKAERSINLTAILEHPMTKETVQIVNQHHQVGVNLKQKIILKLIKIKSINLIHFYIHIRESILTIKSFL